MVFQYRRHFAKYVCTTITVLAKRTTDSRNITKENKSAPEFFCVQSQYKQGDKHLESMLQYIVGSLLIAIASVGFLIAGPLASPSCGDACLPEAPEPAQGIAVHPFFRECSCLDYPERVQSESLPNVRTLSNQYAAQGPTTRIPNPANLSSMVILYGQFVDHGITTSRSDPEAPKYVIPVPEDPSDPFHVHGIETLEVSQHVKTTDANGCTVSISFTSPKIDASNIYSYDAETASELRGPDGTMKVVNSDANGGFLPPNSHPEGHHETVVFAGDHRADEHTGLLAMHTLWVREHNYWARWIKEKKPEWTSDQIYNKARQIVTAEYQRITYEEWLPALLGHPLDERREFPVPTAEISLEFAAAAFRFGHSGVNNFLGSIEMKNTFGNVQLLIDDGVGSVLKTFSEMYMESIDGKVIDGLRNFLFGPLGLDLNAINIMRGRDVGLPNWADAQRCFGFQPAPFDEEKDFFVGMLSQDPPPGQVLPDLIQQIIERQFKRLRDSDDSYFRWNTNSGHKLGSSVFSQVSKVTLADVIVRNTVLDSTDIPSNVFYVE